MSITICACISINICICIHTHAGTGVSVDTQGYPVLQWDPGRDSGGAPLGG